MQVLVNNFGERIRVYRPYINREEEARNVSIFVPESSTNVGLYDWEQVDHLTGNSWPGLFVNESQAANQWWGMTPFPQNQTKSYAATLPNVTSTPQNTFQRRPYQQAQYKRLAAIYG